MLRQLLMSRRPGPDSTESNGHGRSTFLADARPMMSNLFFTASDGQSPADLRKKFLDACKQNGQKWGLLIREMDNPVIASSSQDELSDCARRSGRRRAERRPLAAAGLSRQRGRRERGAGARRDAFRSDHAHAAQSDGHRQRSHGFSLSSRARTRKSPARRWAPSAPRKAACPPTSSRRLCCSKRSKCTARTASRAACRWCLRPRCSSPAASRVNDRRPRGASRRGPRRTSIV